MKTRGRKKGERTQQDKKDIIKRREARVQRINRKPKCWRGRKITETGTRGRKEGKAKGKVRREEADRAESGTDAAHMAARSVRTSACVCVWTHTLCNDSHSLLTADGELWRR